MSETDLQRRMEELGIREEDLVERFVLGGGPGGQKINKTASCVYLKHPPTGEEVKCQRSRSRASNRELAREELCDRIESKRQAAQQARRSAAAKRRALSRGRSRSTRRKLRQQKQRRSETKRRRGRVRGSDD